MHPDDQDRPYVIIAYAAAVLYGVAIGVAGTLFIQWVCA
jgi:hypothetical protein